MLPMSIHCTLPNVISFLLIVKMLTRIERNINTNTNTYNDMDVRSICINGVLGTSTILCVCVCVTGDQRLELKKQQQQQNTLWHPRKGIFVHSTVVIERG